MSQNKDITQYYNPLLIESNKIGREIIINNPYKYLWTSVFPKVKNICLNEMMQELDSSINTQDDLQEFRNQLDKFELRMNHIN